LPTTNLPTTNLPTTNLPTTNLPTRHIFNTNLIYSNLTQLYLTLSMYVGYQLTPALAIRRANTINGTHLKPAAGCQAINVSVDNMPFAYCRQYICGVDNLEVDIRT
jgi:hypothetical protein